MLLLKRAAVLVFLAALGGCGFEPLHGRVAGGSSTSVELAQVRIEIIRDRNGQVLRNFLLDRFSPRGVSRDPQWSLEVRVNESITSLGVQKTSEATRANLLMTGSFVLVPIDGEEEPLSGSIKAVSSFDIQRSDFGTLSAEKDARTRALRQIAEDLTARISVYFRLVLERGSAS